MNVEGVSKDSGVIPELGTSSLMPANDILTPKDFQTIVNIE